jgi:hypothetical protein
MGTGAFSTMESGERDMEVKVAADSKAYVELKPTSAYAEETEDGKLRLFFNDEQGVFEGGLNPDSTYNFEGVFKVGGDHEFGDTYFYIETQGFDEDDVDVEFTAAEDDNSGNSFPNTPGQTLTDPENPYKLFQPDEVAVDMTIEASSSTNAHAGGEIIIHAASGGNQGQL